MNDYSRLFSLKGKVVYVAGGTGLLGAEISRAAAGMGASVVILDIDHVKGKRLEQQLRRSGFKACFEYFDITDLENTQTHLEACARAHQPPEVWVNAAYPRTKDWALPLEQMTLDYLRRNMDMHLNACLWSGRKVALMMKKAKIKGSIIHFGSIYGVRANDLSVYEGTAMSGEMTYCAIKAGIINLTRYLASYFGRHGIRANTVCPGGIFDRQDKIFVKNYQRRVPLKAMGTPSQVASAVLFLASDASSYITGETLMVDGGWTAV